MAVTFDPKRGRAVAELLYRCFSTTGIHGRTEMPEDILPSGVLRGSLDQILFLTLTVAIDYQRDANALWDCSRKAFQDPQTRYLFDLRLLHETPPAKIAEDMKRSGLSKKYRKDPLTWRSVGVTFYKKWGSDPRNFLADCHYDAPTVLKRLKSDRHNYRDKLVADYPFLRGAKIGPLWLRMLRDNVGITDLINLDKVPIPVDIHVARATLCTGIVRGQYNGNLTALFKQIRQAWFQSVSGLSIKNRPMIALDVDEPLWHLSKYGCSDRDSSGEGCPNAARCEAAAFCIPGKISLAKNRLEIDT